jgi:hypothetical protein
MPEGENKKRKPSVRYASVGGNIATVVAIVGGLVYVVSPANSSQGHLLNFKQDAVLFVGFVVLYAIGTGIGYLLGKFMENKKPSA